MRKQCRRKVYQLMNPISLAIEGACITPDEPLSELQRGEQAFLSALLNNTDDLNGYYGLCAMLGIANQENQIHLCMRHQQLLVLLRV